MATTQKSDVSQRSGDMMAMLPYWNQIEAILGGASTMRAAGETYLPKLPNEKPDAYSHRQKVAKFTNIFGDILANLAEKPFSEELTLGESTPEDVIELSENIDAQGNHIHVFASNCMHHGLANGVHWIFVDYHKTQGALRTIAEEKRAGVRPYWLSIKAKDMLAADTAMINGVRQYSHVRFKAQRTKRDGYDEKVVDQVYEYNRYPLTVDGAVTSNFSNPKFKLWERDTDDATNTGWKLVGQETDLTIAEIPLVGFITGKRKDSSLKMTPLLLDAADMQVTLFKYESELDYAKEATAFPMLAGNGVNPPVDDKGKPVDVPVGPKAVLFAPPGGDGNHGEWSFIEPSATSLKFLAEDIKQTKEDLRQLGRQPLTSQSGNVTVVTSATAAQKGNSAIQASALLLKDSLENAYRFTMMWLNRTDKIEVSIFTDFEIGLSGEDFADLLLMNERSLISDEALIAEARRRNILSENYDREKDLELLGDVESVEDGLEPEPEDDEGEEGDENPASKDKQESPIKALIKALKGADNG